YLVERTPSVGGHMAQLDKTFPTLDCSACILTPKMTQVGHHPNIELLTYSEVEEVSGYVGNFKVKVRKRARYVDLNKCTGCGECEKVCPVEVPSEYELGLTQRNAIYRPFAQAVPNAYTIDKEGYPPCRAACPAGVNAQGYIALISKGNFTGALELFRRTQPFAGVCGRVCTHPCETECERGNVDEPIAIRSLKRFMSDYELKAGREKATPVERTSEDKVAVVGSGPAGLTCAYDLVRQGYPVTVFEAALEAGGMLRYGIPEYRLPNDILDNEISYITELGVEIKTGTPINDIADLKKQGYKAVYLATGAWDSTKMGIPNEEVEGVVYGLDFLKVVNSGEKVALGKRVVVIGGGNAAIDAARVAIRMGVEEVTIIYRRSRVEMPAIADEIDEAEAEGVKLHLLVTPVEVLTQNNKLTGIRCVSMGLGEPDASGRRRPVPVKGSEFDLKVDNVILAVGQKVDKSMLPDDIECASWGTVSADPVSLQANIKGVFAGGDVVSGPADVIAAIAAGKEAAVSVDRYLKGIDLKEGRPKAVKRVKEVSKEGVESKPRQAMPALEVDRRKGFTEVELGFDEAAAIVEAGRCLNCGVCSECLECVKVCEVKAINHEMEEEILELDAGSIILATGFELFEPRGVYKYGYGIYDNVLTSLELERTLSASGPTSGEVLLKDGSHPRTVATIHCVGSRDKDYHEYCSRVCCMYSLKFSHLLKEHVPGVEVFDFYVDMRSFGKGFEEFYNRIAREGTDFIRSRPTGVTQEDGKLVVEYELNGSSLRQPVDMVVLCVALEARPDAEAVARVFNISRSADGFFLEKHPKLDPVATMTDGTFVVGCCQGPKDIPDTVAQASATAAEALAIISKGTVEIEAATSVIDAQICAGCQVCRLVCPYSAISFDEDFSFKPGQFAELSVLGTGEATFCISSSPTRMGHMECAINKVGTVTKAIHRLGVGAEIGFRGPYGNSFPLDFLQGKNLVFVGGGIGLAPLRSLIWNVIDDRDKYKNVDIIYGARSPGDLCFKYDLEAWEKDPGINMTTTVDHGNEQWSGKEGFVPQILEEVAPLSKNAVAIVCGPPVMIRFTFPVLEKLGFAPEQMITTLEKRMKCGIGKCGRCNIGNLYVCRDGPVFSYAQIKSFISSEY
ncbi:NAD(P)-binding protein, partial [Chloroflexota bacterium]